MVITKGIDVSDEMFASGGFADVRSGTYLGHLVAVKTMRVTAQDVILKIRRVGINIGHEGRGLNSSAPGFLQGTCPLEHPISSECHGTCWGRGRYGERGICHCVGVDDARKHHGVHQS